MAAQRATVFRQPPASHLCRMTSRTLLSVTNSVQPELQVERNEGTCCAHWPAAPGGPPPAAIKTAACWEAGLLQLLRPPSTAEPPAPVVPPLPPRPPVA